MKKYIVLFGIILTATLIGGCNFPGFKWNSPTPNVTQAYQTIQAQIATLGQVMGTATIQPFTATITPPTTIQITPSSSIQVLPSATRQPTQICDRASPGNPIDVTIPDDSVVTPGAEFIKTWRLVNDGACTWTRQYALIWFSGDQFTDTKIIYLRQDVAPGQSIDFSVDMTAPNKSGSYQSNWMLQNPSGVYFGIGPNGKSPFWVRISVESGSKPTNTPMGTGELYLYYSGVVILTEGSSVDFTSGNTSPDSSLDLFYGSNKLSPADTVSLGGENISQPDPASCARAAMDVTNIQTSADTLYHYYCFQKTSGEVGYIQILNLSDDGEITLEVNTWGY